LLSCCAMILKIFITCSSNMAYLQPIQRGDWQGFTVSVMPHHNEKPHGVPSVV
jgi:hypothetical protein